MAKREFLLLANDYNTESLSNKMSSEKLDGQRCFWDGGITRGQPKSEVPWANTEKDYRFKVRQFSTGLWSRYGHVIHAPKEWLDQLPPVFLDGELWLGRGEGMRQLLSTIIKPLIPNPEEWRKVKFKVFDSPPPDMIFSDGVINNTNFRKILKGISVDTSNLIYVAKVGEKFKTVAAAMSNILATDDEATVSWHRQITLSSNRATAFGEAMHHLETVTREGGEGIMIRDPWSAWVPARSHDILKIKHLRDSEGTVIGYTAGRVGIEGRLLGLIGNVIVDFDGKRLEVSGFTMSEREFATTEMTDWATKNPGEEAPTWVTSKKFPRGTRITFRYRECSTAGIPIEARYWRNEI